MTKRTLKRPVVYTIYAVSFIFVLGMIYMVSSIKKPLADKTKYVHKSILDNQIPVVGDKTSITKPFTDSSVKVVRGFYDFKGEKGKQEKALIYYDNTYIPNSGVDYSGNKSFEVVSILDGTVLSVEETQLLGKVVKISHSNNIISIYQSLSNVDVKKDEFVPQGTLIGVSGEANISLDLKNHLHFELVIDGETVNPEEYYDKTVADL